AHAHLAPGGRGLPGFAGLPVGTGRGGPARRRLALPDAATRRADRVRDLGGVRRAREGPRAVQPEVRAQPERLALAEAQEELLAPRLARDQAAAVEHRGAVGEPALRAADPQDLAVEQRGE